MKQTLFNFLVCLAVWAAGFNLLPAQTVILKIDSVTVACPDTVQLPVRVKDFTNVGVMTFSVGWNKNQLQYLSVSAVDPLFTAGGANAVLALDSTANGKLAFVWTRLGGATIPDTTRIFTLTFKRLGGGFAPVRFTNDPTAVEIGDASINPVQLDADTISGGVQVGDMQAPTLQCPPNQSISASQPTAVDNIGPVNVSDNCGLASLGWEATGATTSNQPNNIDASGTTFNLGLTTVTYKVTDNTGFVSTCSFQINMVADTALQLILDTLAPDCSSMTKTVVYRLKVRNFKNLIGLQFRLLWDETVLQFDTVQNVFPGINLTAADFFNFSSIDTGEIKFLAGSPPPLPTWPAIPNGETLFELKFNVLNNNASTKLEFASPIEAVDSEFNPEAVLTFNGLYTQGDSTPPVYTVCPVNVEVEVDNSGVCSAVVILPNPVAVDACSGLKDIVADKQDSLFVVGSTNVMFTATDSAGNSSTCTLMVTVTEPIPPTLSDCPDDLTALTSVGLCSQSIVWNPPTAFDNCDPNVVVTPSIPNGSLFDVGTTVVTYTAIDLSGNTDTCSFSITIQDVTPPFITCPADLIINTGLNKCDATVSFGLPTGTDGCDPTIDYLADPPSGSVLAAGSHLITYYASDDAGNTSSCKFNILVKDTDAPSLVCPPDQLINTLNDTCVGTASWPLPTSSDACDPVLTLTVDVQQGQTLPVGIQVVTYTATDNSGNTSQCSFQVRIAETQPPLFIFCPSDVFVTLPDVDCDTTVTWTEPIFSDNCGNPTVVPSHTSGSVFQAGTTVVSYVATDNSGNSSSCTFNVNVQETIAPQLVNCPPSDTINNADPCGVKYPWALPMATDNCDPNPVVSSTRDTAALFFAGVTNIIILASDASNNFDTCSFTIVVNQGIVPNLENMPADITLPAPLGSCEAVVSWTPPTVVGVCTYDLTSNYEPGDTFPTGATTVTYTVSYQGTTITESSFIVSVLESTPPVIQCPVSPILVSATDGIVADPGSFIDSAEPQNDCQGVILEFGLPSATDNCNGVQVVQVSGPVSGDMFASGVYTLAFQAVDASGNLAPCAVAVTVEGYSVNVSAFPNPGCQGEKVTLSTAPINNATYTWQQVSDPGKTFPSQSWLEIPNLNQGTKGKYTLSVQAGNCSIPPDTIDVFLVEDPQAMGDNDITLDINQLDTFNILANDLLTPAFDFYIKKIGNAPNGLVSVDTITGQVIYQAGSTPSTVTFFYEVCSKTCPDRCDMETVTITVVDRTCGTLPNVLTPNGDQQNDFLFIRCLEGNSYPENTLVIYNQWGDKVYEAKPYSNDPRNAWDGTLEGNPGKPLPDGTYYYIFRLAPGESTMTGFIEIFR